MNLLLDPAFHLSQIGDKMEETFAGILEKGLEILPINDETNVGCMTQDLKALHDYFNFFLSLEDPKIESAG
jgi:hypothetical protein